MSLHAVKPLAPALLAAALLSGCRYAPGAAERDPLSPDQYPRITASGALGGDLKFAEPPVVVRNPGEPLRVTAAVRSIRKKPTQAQYRFIFLDADGTPLRMSPGWQQITLPSKTKVYISGTATSDAAVDWRAEVRPEPIGRK